MEKIIIDLTQEQINTMIHDSCVLFCKHCGCGIPRETCTSLGTCKEHDEYRTAIKAHLMEKKKKEYPKTYEECCVLLGAVKDRHYFFTKKDKDDYPNEVRILNVLDGLRRLLICRDAYWKLYGEKKGLGKPWEPDWSNKNELKYCIENRYDKGIHYDVLVHTQKIFAFPSAEMRDAFYEAFREEIEICKELL